MCDLKFFVLIFIYFLIRKGFFQTFILTEWSFARFQERSVFFDPGAGLC